MYMKEKIAMICQKFKQLRAWQKILVLTVILTINSIVGLVLVSAFGKPTIISSVPPDTKEVVVPDEPRDISNPLNGVLYKQSEAKLWQNRLPLAVMVENLVDIRPQSGLSRADIVYEALVEGGITRFMAVYLAEDINEIGPIRSSRPYYIDWAEELGALYAHIGGSPAALDKLVDDNVKTLPEEWPYYKRKNSTLSSEHTAFSSTGSLWDMAQSKGYTGKTSIKSWRFKEDASSSARPASAQIKLDFSGQKDYKVQWEYEAENNVYRRSAGSPAREHTDLVNNEQLNAKNVIVQFAKLSTLNDEKGRVEIQTTDAGVARIFTDGKETDATWKKSSSTSRTTFYDTTGREIEFNRGKIWVEVVPDGSSVEYS